MTPWHNLEQAQSVRFAYMPSTDDKDCEHQRHLHSEFCNFYKMLGLRSLSKDVSMSLIGDPVNLQKQNIPIILTKQFKQALIKYVYTHIGKTPEQRAQNCNLLKEIWLTEEFQCSHFCYEYKITGFSKPIKPKKLPDSMIPETLWDRKGKRLLVTVRTICDT